MQSIIKSLILILLFAGCKTYKTKYPYSLSDFNPELRMRLEKIVQNGGICDIETYSTDENRVPEYYDYLTKKASANDLRKLIDCEHPVLRAFAFYCLINKEDSSINQILLNHLDDTATITVCEGEFGENYKYVSDYFISQSKWDTKIFKTDLIDTVVMNHTYLNYAYYFIADLENPEEKYYQRIKQMTLNPGSIQNSLREMIAISVLSKYKKTEDIPLIAEKLSKNWAMSDYHYDSCFSIIVHNPDTAYFKIIESFYRMIARPQKKEELQHNFITGYYKLGEKYSSFIEALVSYKNKRSSEMIDTIIKKELYPLNLYSSQNYRYTIYHLLKGNQCPEYKKLIKLLEPEALAYDKKMLKYNLPPMDVTFDSSYRSKHDPKYW
jgi:hypothetical protein